MNRPFDSLMVQTMLRPIVIIMQLYGVYVLLHGHYSPGGGFQSGVLVACSMLLPTLVYGRRAARRHGFVALSESQSLALAMVGLLIYAGIGIVSLAQGQALLNYEFLPLAGLDPASRRSLGILGIEVGVTFGVAGASLAIYHRLEKPEEPT